MSNTRAARQEVIVKHPDAYQIKVPLPFPLRWVNAYVLGGPTGWTIIDPGLRTAEAEKVWQAVFGELGLEPKRIERIVLTHHHPDHYGLAGWMQELADAPVLLSRTGLEQVKLLWGAGTPLTDQLLALFLRHGLPDELTAPMREHMDGFVPAVSPQPEVTVMEDGEDIPLGGRVYRAIHTPGHAAGHLCFYRAETKVMFCGDHVLPQISPNVSYLTERIDANPLDSYLSSLEEMSRYEVNFAYPGHREPFSRFAERTGELIAHHEERLEAMASLLAEPQTAYEVCQSMFGDRLSLHQLRFALAETLAHLIWLQEAGRLSAEEEQGVIRFAKKSG
ncbi:Glyoxylase, beta-lactamase superfamily II [Paenibacillus sp. UNCCL117]|uniref:MBL fold metallo-hydrolase n=1 Tax=unclassified Paenibacillus TaxID=185978 RepID=UPI0008917544|nr:MULTISPECIES: MBL fold metallo-hydrolase [unclassified Paenibacillus]SDD26356.1 Glyoxylase, beta-lactamase superfamily II [Paenibacillus sp. cl123]SFW41106.1 Glyoxylase, beta-lactamase superfamily II [Paenibacillus sp. UNCCL117]